MASGVVEMGRKKFMDDLLIKTIDEAIRYARVKPKPIVTVEMLATKEKK
jgi:hypothetical protein